MANFLKHFTTSRPISPSINLFFFLKSDIYVLVKKGGENFQKIPFLTCGKFLPKTLMLGLTLHLTSFALGKIAPWVCKFCALLLFFLSFNIEKWYYTIFFFQNSMEKLIVILGYFYMKSWILDLFTRFSGENPLQNNLFYQ